MEIASDCALALEHTTANLCFLRNRHAFVTRAQIQRHDKAAKRKHKWDHLLLKRLEGRGGIRISCVVNDLGHVRMHCTTQFLTGRLHLTRRDTIFILRDQLERDGHLTPPDLQGSQLASAACQGAHAI